MKFGKALKKCQRGEFITRSDWNGKNMFVYYVSCSDESIKNLPYNISAFLEKQGKSEVRTHGYFSMYTAQGEIVIGWLASQTDMSSEKWEIFEPQVILELGENGSGNDGDERTINGIECVLVKAGTFTMGSPTSEAGRRENETQHQVTLTQDYYISKYPITNSQYGINAGAGKENHPVVNVNWTEANAWAQSIGGSLPTEAQWEFAARGGVNSKGYIYSGSNNLGTVGWHFGNSGDQTHPVGQKQPNELGIYDMSGNVWEWCNDWNGAYPTNAVTNPTGPSTGVNRVLRGGSWEDYASDCRVANRGNQNPSVNVSYIGFRVAFPRN